MNLIKKILESMIINDYVCLVSEDSFKIIGIPCRGLDGVWNVGRFNFRLDDIKKVVFEANRKPVIYINNKFDNMLSYSKILPLGGVRDSASGGKYELVVFTKDGYREFAVFFLDKWELSNCLNKGLISYSYRFGRWINEAPYLEIKRELGRVSY